MILNENKNSDFLLREEELDAEAKDNDGNFATFQYRGN